MKARRRVQRKRKHDAEGVYGNWARLYSKRQPGTFGTSDSTVTPASVTAHPAKLIVVTTPATRGASPSNARTRDSDIVRALTRPWCRSSFRHSHSSSRSRICCRAHRRRALFVWTIPKAGPQRARSPRWSCTCGLHGRVCQVPSNHWDWTWTGRFSLVQRPEGGKPHEGINAGIARETEGGGMSATAT